MVAYSWEALWNTSIACYVLQILELYRNNQGPISSVFLYPSAIRYNLEPAVCYSEEQYKFVCIWKGIW